MVLIIHFWAESEGFVDKVFLKKVKTYQKLKNKGKSGKTWFSMEIRKLQKSTFV